MPNRLNLKMGDRFRLLKKLDNKLKFLFDVQKLGGLSNVTLKKGNNLATFYDSRAEGEGGLVAEKTVFPTCDWLLKMMLLAIVVSIASCERPFRVS